MKILIVEDEVHIARHLEKKIRKIWSAADCTISRAAALEEAMDYLDNNEIGLLLLDLNLGGEDGFEVLKVLAAGSFHTIVVSAYKGRAIEAFEYGVLDFVPKPFSEERLRKALNRVMNTDSKPDYPTQYYAVRKRGAIHLVKDDEVAYFRAFGHYSKIHLKNGRTELHSKPLARLMPLLGEDYERVHRSYIVKMSEVKGIHVFEGGKYELELRNGEVVPLGRAKYKRIQEKWLR
ncbi:MAG: response regulator transcription factor [Phaeodactylibacter sp.]|nr:response regulator transcription factor [Phaeodactylibacter sp.]